VDEQIVDQIVDRIVARLKAEMVPLLASKEDVALLSTVRRHYTFYK
jgi:hypothetical protein